MINDTIGIESHLFADAIVNALDCLHESDAMTKIFKQEQYQNVFRTAPHFFMTAQQAMLYRFHLEVEKLFESKSKTKNFDTFKNELSQQKVISDEIRREYGERRKSAQKTLTAIHNRRNKWIAHTDADICNDVNSFLKENSVDYESVEKLLQYMLYMCNYAIQHIEFVPQLHATAFGDDFIRLFGCETEAEKTYQNWITHEK